MMGDSGMQDIYTLQIKKHSRSNDIVSPNCEACQKGFLHINSLQVREFTQTGKLPGVCKSCNAAFLKICRLQIKNLTQNDQHYHVCDYCGKSFTHAGNYLKHKRLHEIKNENEVPIPPPRNSHHHQVKPTPPYSCEHCGKVFMKYGSFLNHMESHQNNENLKCPICDKLCANKTTFEKHLVFCQNRQAVYVCPYCESTFNTKSNLKAHMEMHVVAEPETHVCKFCKLSFVVAEELEKHLLEHLSDHIKEEPLEDSKEKFNHFCVKCNKGFMHLGTLRNHMKKHSESLPFKCKTCKKQFVQSHRLKRHMKMHKLQTINQLPFQCKMCSKRFRSVKSMRKHKSLFHGKS